MRLTLAAGAVLFLGFVQSSFGGAIFGSFDMSGVVIATSSAIDFETDQTGNAPNLFTMSGGTGSFTGISGQQDIADIADEAVNTTFGPDTFITIAGITPTLEINEIYGGTSPNTTAATCAAPATTCTPNYLAGALGSPFTFTDFGTNSTATWVVSGVTSDGLSTWEAIFTAQFTETYQQELATFISTGSLSNSYSATATVTVTPITTPEPATWTFILLGSGLIGLAKLRFRRPAK